MRELEGVRARWVFERGFQRARVRCVVARRGDAMILAGAVDHVDRAVVMVAPQTNELRADYRLLYI